ncbi:uncharacterized protein LOC128991611 [Macrosteles quadrilineatus]|uniref:uncharacterized protein LOC128991611 n=1 Tax=Macrosteles quadrilineatus TaxID=74068 RepID=UPI0023E181C4|nr:uncharacterized protein LOC128991611 [Macrosteles quadrilineatus]
MIKEIKATIFSSLATPKQTMGLAGLQEILSVACLLTTSGLTFHIENHQQNLHQNNGSRVVRSVSPWDYFPMVPLNIHDFLETEQMSGKTERDVHMPEFRPLCQVIRRRVELRDAGGDDEYEYRPPHYFESICKGPNQRNPDFAGTGNSLMCVYPGFSCVQRSQTIYLTRRKFDSNCWEVFTRTIPSNCECMWPVQSLGEVAHHYQQ